MFDDNSEENIYKSPSITCSKSTIETIEHSVKFNVDNEGSKTTSMILLRGLSYQQIIQIVLLLLLLTLS